MKTILLGTTALAFFASSAMAADMPVKAPPIAAVAAYNWTGCYIGAHADQMVRGVVSLPNGSGRTVRVGVFARGPKADEAKAAGADVVGAEDLVEKVQGGNIDFDRCIATPDMMGLVGRLGKVLGPKEIGRAHV